MINDKALVDATIAQLVIDEGFKSKPYRDTVGVWTFGHGLTYITEEESLLVMRHRLQNEYLPALLRLFIGFEVLNDNRKSVLLNMMYNLGASRLARFVKLRNAISTGNYEQASREMLDSKWAAQVGKEPGQRAYEMARVMKHG